MSLVYDWYLHIHGIENIRFLCGYCIQPNIPLQSLSENKKNNNNLEFIYCNGNQKTQNLQFLQR